MILVGPSARSRGSFGGYAFGVVVVAWALACSQAPTDDSDDSDAVAREVDGSETDTPPTPPSDGEVPSNGPLDSCSSTTWTQPSDSKREARCVQYWDETLPEPGLRYVCSCDVEACPIYVPDGEEPGGVSSSAQLNECVVEGVATGCGDSLQAVCGTTAGQHGYCEREYYGLTPTRPNQSPPVSATLVCFEQPDGSHACQCPNAADLVPTNETDCHRALLTACQAPCESAAGQCSPTEGGYACTCAPGFERTVEIGLCDYALFWSCEPACSNEVGACYWDPSGGPEIICQCDGDVGPRTMERDPDVRGDECRTPLVDTCGGSAEGPNAWP